MSFVSLALGAALVLQPAAGATSEPSPEGDVVSGVVVTGRPQMTEQEAIAAFVDDVAATSGNGRIGRWDRKICPGVVGVKPAYGQYLVDRIARSALEVGLEVGEPGCKANVLIIFTKDSGKFTKDAIRQHPDAFARYDLAMTSGRRALRRFENSEAPVRWWHVTHRVTADGEKYGEGESVTARAVGRLRSNTHTDFDRAIVVVDPERVGQVRFEALADYLAFVSLAQIDPDAAPTSADSVLSLFADKDAGREPPERMTSWDMAYLKGVYDARRDTLDDRGQKKDIAREMGKTLSDPPKE